MHSVHSIDDNYPSIFLLSLRNTLISRFFCILFLRPVVSIPQRENIRSTNTCDAGAARKSSAMSTTELHTVFLSNQNLGALTTAELIASSMYRFSCANRESPTVTEVVVVVSWLKILAESCSIMRITMESFLFTNHIRFYFNSISWCNISISIQFQFGKFNSISISISINGIESFPF